MKKLIKILLTVIMCFVFSLTVFGEESETAEDMSTPRLMVTEFQLDGDSLTPGENSKITITLKNYSKSKYIKNIKLSITEESGDIKPIGTGNKFVDIIYAGKTYTWDVELTASSTSQVGEHAITISSEYEDKYSGSYSNSDVIRVNVKQTVGIDFSGVQLPAKVYSDDTTTMQIAIMNTGKSNIRNCKIDFDIINLESGGTTFVGEIEAGGQSSASANLRVGKEFGETGGTVIITYEDEFGESYTKEQKVNTTIVERPIDPVEKDEEQEKYPLWWAFLIGGIALGGAIGCAIPIAINSSKQRKEDEMRL